MTTAVPSTALATIQPAFTDSERLALAGFLAGYRGLTREAYTLDLRQFTTWCRARSLPLFAARRADIEGFARELEARGRARATVTRRLCTIAGLDKYAVEEELLDHSPAARSRAAQESPSPSDRTRSDTHSSPPPWTPACRCVTFRRLPPTLIRGPQSGTTGPAGAWTATPPISSRPTSLALPGNHTA